MRPFVSATGRWNVELFDAIHATADAPHWSIVLARAVIDAPVWVALGLTLWRLARQQGFWQGAWLGALAYGISRAIEAVVGALSFHPRPFAAGYSLMWVQHAANNSMPSSHVTNVLILALVLYAQREAAYGTIVLGLAAVVAWGRVYLGLHWPEDVLGSVFSALLSLGLAALLRRAATLVLRRRAAARAVAPGRPPPPAP